MHETQRALEAAMQLAYSSGSDLMLSLMQTCYAANRSLLNGLEGKP